MTDTLWQRIIDELLQDYNELWASMDNRETPRQIVQRASIRLGKEIDAIFSGKGSGGNFKLRQYRTLELIPEGQAASLMPLLAAERERALEEAKHYASHIKGCGVFNEYSARPCTCGYSGTFGALKPADTAEQTEAPDPKVVATAKGRKEMLPKQNVRRGFSLIYFGTTTECDELGNQKNLSAAFEYVWAAAQRAAVDALEALRTEISASGANPAEAIGLERALSALRKLSA
jgi:hypothetical protein